MGAIFPSRDEQNLMGSGGYVGCHRFDCHWVDGSIVSNRQRCLPKAPFVYHIVQASHGNPQCKIGAWFGNDVRSNLELKAEVSVFIFYIPFGF